MTTAATAASAASATPVRPCFSGLRSWRNCAFHRRLFEYCFLSSFCHFVLGFIGLIV
jgi:hypothetical protein